MQACQLISIVVESDDEAQKTDKVVESDDEAQEANEVVESDDEAKEADEAVESGLVLIELRQGAHSWRGGKCFMFKQTRFFIMFQL